MAGGRRRRREKDGETFLESVNHRLERMEILVAQIHWLHLGQWQLGYEATTMNHAGSIAEGAPKGSCTAAEMKQGGNEAKGMKQSRYIDAEMKKDCYPADVMEQGGGEEAKTMIQAVGARQQRCE